MHTRTRVVAYLVVAFVGWTVAGTLPAHAGAVPKNGRIAFYMDRGNGSEVYSVGPTGGALQQLTHGGGDAYNPDWSPDGRRIVFELDTGGPTYCSIELMNADGTGVVDLTGHRPGCEANPSFTPSGRRIVFVRNRGCHACHDELRTMNLSGGDRRKIATTPRVGKRYVALLDPNVSPDGATIAFVGAKDDAHRALYTISRNGTHLRQIVPFSSDVGTHFAWAPDGSHIVFTEYATGPGNADTVRPDGSDLVAVTKFRHDVGAGGAVYSANGEWILFRLQGDNLHSLWKVRLDGSDRTRIRRLPALFGGLDQSPQST